MLQAALKKGYKMNLRKLNLFKVSLKYQNNGRFETNIVIISNIMKMFRLSNNKHMHTTILGAHKLSFVSIFSIYFRI